MEDAKASSRQMLIPASNCKKSAGDVPTVVGATSLSVLGEYVLFVPVACERSWTCIWGETVFLTVSSEPAGRQGGCDKSLGGSS